ncbi:MAG TPA: selenide, water dikinase SelD [Flavobacteriales bacterium]|nr:selenide, water dikinase SelD [Flavobacteriales bacterium]
METREPEPVRLTQLSHGSGCGCKIAPADLEKILASKLGTLPHPKLLVGYGSKDDAAVYDLGDGRAVISTTDFFTPIVDDAFDFGRIAATNALSDVYAMGGTPLLAVAILGWPLEKLGAELAAQVVEGGRQACHDAGIPLAGGHSIDAPEPFFGLAVTGEVRMENLKRNNTAQPGDALLLTKPLGIGIMSTAQKRGKLREEHLHIARDLMITPNSLGMELGKLNGVHALTDVTGFGLLGHLLEMCTGSGVSAVLNYASVPVIPESRTYLNEGCYPDGALRNWKSVAQNIRGINGMESLITLCDPQTSGGLLIACKYELVDRIVSLSDKFKGRAHLIGKLIPADSGKTIDVT